MSKKRGLPPQSSLIRDAVMAETPTGSISRLTVVKSIEGFSCMKSSPRAPE
eukprot:CAMPEP_0204086592 /NCGR_PEP_ID=MMETSP0360-20130528/183290_1 /ASSEMBLY_ACC=CAM_ASM_000342 /TAXON_ID=268821 /ORGANISM="Scrippsiella Hangoei, Strain SHTV-5" /LENGTH=50 /DNA_ID=CAMNT_0051035695 /DNA_START=164 /DNA_END=313 /DNA_ORIENTATION=-